MPSWKKIIVSGSDAELNQLTATSFGGDISGSSTSTGSFGHINTDTITSFRINGSPTFTGDSTGFGIGVNDPGFGLDVASSGRFTGTLTLGQASSTDGTIVLHNNTGAATFTIQNEDGNGLFQAGSNSTRHLHLKILVPEIN